ncbi:MAG: hypothetical protein HYT75_06500 [Deltaproteobacteria bacterium]|nr:hypothetical protein [Deltaproteobacteria bacterium]
MQLSELSAGIIFWGMMISIVGWAFFRVGKKNADILTVITGLVLMIYPYFIWSLGWSIFTGVAVCAVYYFLKRVVNL